MVVFSFCGGKKERTKDSEKVSMTGSELNMNYKLELNE